MFANHRQGKPANQLACTYGSARSQATRNEWATTGTSPTARAIFSRSGTIRSNSRQSPFANRAEPLAFRWATNMTSRTMNGRWCPGRSPDRRAPAHTREASIRSTHTSNVAKADGAASTGSSTPAALVTSTIGANNENARSSSKANMRWKTGTNVLRRWTARPSRETANSRHHSRRSAD